MSFYDRFILPRIVHLVCGTRPTMRQRQKVVPLATGKVLELGFGSGLNLPFYDVEKVSHVWALDPSREMWELAKSNVERAEHAIELLEASAEDIPLEDGSADTVLVTYSLCTIPDADRALGEVRRVLKADGSLVFCEHGEAPDESVRRWQTRLDPIWQRFSGGCHLDRPIPALIERNGFAIDEISTMYLPGWKPASFNYWGVARQK